MMSRDDPALEIMEYWPPSTILSVLSSFIQVKFWLGTAVAVQVKVTELPNSAHWTAGVTKTGPEENAQNKGKNKCNPPYDFSDFEFGVQLLQIVVWYMATGLYITLHSSTARLDGIHPGQTHTIGIRDSPYHRNVRNKEAKFIWIYSLRLRCSVRCPTGCPSLKYDHWHCCITFKI